VIVFALARALLVGLSGLRTTHVSGLVGRILHHPSRCVLISMTRVVDQLLLGQLETLGFPFPAFDERSLGFADALVARRILTGPAADPSRLGAGRSGLIVGSVSFSHRVLATLATVGQIARDPARHSRVRIANTPIGPDQ
jgi:hypothetical protein